MKTTATNSEICNSLLRGELSAIETYTQAIERLPAQRNHIAALKQYKSKAV